MAADRHVDFFKFQNINGLNAEEVQTAASCQISWRSMKLLRRYIDFWIYFPDGGRHRLGFLKFRIFNQRHGIASRVS